MSDWSAREYLKFKEERTRSARDLLAHVQLEQARVVVDLACDAPAVLAPLTNYQLL
jgi:trans-aconitate 2-methyltransferase